MIRIFPQPAQALEAAHPESPGTDHCRLRTATWIGELAEIAIGETIC